MQYFSTLPKVIYSDKNKVSKVFTNLLARANVKPSLLTNPLIFYTYDIQDDDTPEIVAYKYYGDIYRYWIVLYSNEIMDPQWDWPLSRNQFESYILNKYDVIDPYTTPHHYEKIITQYDENTLTTTTNTIVIDEQTYNSLVETNNTYNLPTGPVNVSITKNAVSLYEYELNKNEAKRNIKILNKNYANQLETELKALMK